MKNQQKSSSLARGKNKMSHNAPVKKERPTSIRIPNTLEDKIAEAVALSGMSKTNFIKNGIEQYAEMIIEKMLNENEEKKFLVLNQENFRRFSEALDNPPEPTQALRDFMSKSKWKT